MKDVRPRCLRCNKLPRGRLQSANFERYAPYCSYQCQQYHRLDEARAYLNSLPPLGDLP